MAEYDGWNLRTEARVMGMRSPSDPFQGRMGIIPINTPCGDCSDTNPVQFLFLFVQSKILYSVIMSH